MKRLRLFNVSLLLFAAMAEFGCAGTETGNPPHATVSFRLSTSDAALFSIDADGAGVNITQARIGLEQLAFTSCEQTVTDVAQAVAVDLTDAETLFEVPEQSLCLVELSLGNRDLDWADVRSGSAAELSLGVAGLTELDAPLFVEDEASPSVVFRPSMFQVTSATELVFSLDIATALSFPEVQQAAPNNAGEVIITSTENAVILQAVRDRWTASWRLFSVNDSGDLELVATGEAQ